MNRHFRGEAAALAAAASVLAGCSLAPDYKVPETATPVVYKEDGEWKTAAPADEAPRGAWWKLLGDKTLDDLEDKVAGANQNLKATLAQFEQAQAQLRIASADTAPQVQGNAAANEQRHSGTTGNPLPRRNFADYALNVTVSYEIDVWGRVRNSVEAAKDQAQAGAGDLATTELELRADLAADYFALRGLDTQQRILDETVTAFAQALDLTGRRHDGGVQPVADVAQAQGQLETAKTQAADNHLHRQQLEHAIAILVGVMPSDFGLPALPLDDRPPPPVEVGLPSALLERRPDVAAAERRVAAANAQIGVARAAAYPVFDLESMLGVESGLPQKLFGAPSSLWSLGPTAAVTLFDGGRIDAMTDQARKAYDQTVAQYRQSVLTANGEVEDQLIALRQLDKEIRTQSAAVTATQKALDQSKLRYTAGIVTYIEVVDNENLALAAQLSQADIITRRMTSTVQLIKALGGGWSSDTGLDLAQAPTDRQAQNQQAMTK
jgi:NodT family efflux transporter outer membrane factor (OMF) lipoprotein